MRVAGVDARGAELAVWAARGDRAAAGGGAGSRGVGEAAREEEPEALGARGDRAAAGEVADPRFAGEDARGEELEVLGAPGDGAAVSGAGGDERVDTVRVALGAPTTILKFENELVNKRTGLVGGVGVPRS